MFSRFSACLIVLVIAFLFVASYALAHPADGYPAKELPEAYGTDAYGYGPEYSIGDLVFTGSFPDPATLTEQERYIIAGAEGAPDRAQLSWSSEIVLFLISYNSLHGEMPKMIDREAILSTSIDDSIFDTRLELFKSPITGDYVRTDAYNFEPGQLYCRMLNETEMRHIADINSQFRRLWFESAMYDPDGNYVPVSVKGAPLYIRIYGFNGVIYEGIHGIWTES